jgi:hypothetical protein
MAKAGNKSIWKRLPKRRFFIDDSPVYFKASKKSKKLWRKPSPPVRKISGKEWVPIAFERRRAELFTMGITEAARALANESEKAPDCAKALKARSVENLLRDNKYFPKKSR